MVVGAGVHFPTPYATMMVGPTNMQIQIVPLHLHLEVYAKVLVILTHWSFLLMLVLWETWMLKTLEFKQEV